MQVEVGIKKEKEAQEVLVGVTGRGRERGRGRGEVEMIEETEKDRIQVEAEITDPMIIDLEKSPGEEIQFQVQLQEVVIPGLLQLSHQMDLGSRI